MIEAEQKLINTKSELEKLRIDRHRSVFASSRSEYRFLTAEEMSIKLKEMKDNRASTFTNQVQSQLR